MEIREADLRDRNDAAAVVEVLDAFARDPNGQGAPLSDHARDNVVAGLRAHATAMVLLAFEGERAVGVAVCIGTFSTFAAAPAMNVHDIAVLEEDRGKGIGAKLLAAVEQHARQRGCCKVTLEVHDTNEGAKRLYARAGFGPFVPATFFVTKPL